ncbi:MAG: ABC transporter permease [Geminicoccales bacterium]
MWLRIGSIAGAVAIWWLLSLLLPANIMPSPASATTTLLADIAEGEVWSHLAITLVRVVGGLLLAMLIGVPVGVLMGANHRAERFFDIWVMVALTVPSLCYAIICFIVFGLNEVAAIIAIALTAAPSITINLWEGVKTVDSKLLQMARAYEADRWVLFSRVLLPQVLPYVMASFRFGLGIIWKITVLVELLGRPNGVGFKLFYWYQLADMEQVLAWTLLFTVIMLFIELVILKRVESWLFGWRPRVSV